MLPGNPANPEGFKEDGVLVYLHFIFDLCEALFINTMRILLKNGKIYDGTGHEVLSGDALAAVLE